MSKNPTIADVAKMAGVSVTTVSRILNGNYHKMRPATRQKVEAVIKKVNYVPAASARRLRQNHGNVIGIFVGDVANPFSTLLAKGIGDVLQEADYDILLMNTDNSNQREARAIQRLLEQQVDGIIAQPDTNHFEDYQEIINHGIPLVVVDREIPDQPSSVTRVTSCNQDACYQLGKTLVARGYQNILTVSARFAQASGQIPRIAGLKATALENGLSFHNLETRGHDQAWLVKNMGRLINELPGRTVVISLMGPVLFDLLDAFTTLGLSFPEDIGLVSFDDWEWSRYVGQGIFLLKQDMELMGNIAAKRLLESIRGEGQGCTTLLPVEVVDRPSL